ncbi:esterase/lipase [Sphaerochaeta pleomorpha str. Grapes]|uniref:Esterase/lipase n=1 Tax=Sphaerochaeta pleomorpha (strain ATCC BAA-1885 / DSM 22778 / Grapes) TaxID=158190 RepID=G8QRV0_SPHPG|nr:alpha/beta hydrolase [Sphaerochaeta pleomorpha]AEV28883.1 esterase/lipase [Sphaerochaeta pleomorpha str. Grapes]
MKIIQTAVGKNQVPLTGYLQSFTQDGGIRNIRPSIVICPGGAYRFRSERERDPVALYFLSLGYNVFILDYSVRDEASNLNPLIEASDAIIKIREHSVPWMCDPYHIAIMGFSAGGHVAASLAILHDHPRLKAVFDTKDGLNRPDAAVLCYPVISTGEFCHQESADWVSGKLEADRALFCLENQVSSTTVPSFIWHTVTDASVPVENSLQLASALQRQNVPFELHLFSEGVHGLSMCNQEVGTPNTACQQWVGLCTTWLNNRFDFTL